jgi:metallo-beta-lactamase family protein
VGVIVDFFGSIQNPASNPRKSQVFKEHGMTTVRIRLLGATDTVTGSRTLLTVGHKNWLIDCGLFQGPKELRQRNWNSTPLPSLEGVILTHAHLDHSGFLPRLVSSGFKGPIHCSEGTSDLLQILLRDAAYLEEEFATYANQSGYSDHKPALPLFTIKDAEKALRLVKPYKRNALSDWIVLSEGISFRFIRAGHIIGASMVQIAFTTNKGPKLITFSGDLGNNRSVTMKSPEKLLETDVLILESTYGQRITERQDTQALLAKIVNSTFEDSGVLVIPAFAIGRAQEILHRLRLLENHKMIPQRPVILDSPMAEKATAIFLRHGEDHLSPEFADCYRKTRDTLEESSDGHTSLTNGDLEACASFLPHHFEVSTSPNDSMLACMRDGPLIIISASGMLHGGRILHHLKHRLPNPHNTVLFTGYQAPGTKGRWLLDRSLGLATGDLRIHHQIVPIAAKIEKIDAFSSHADQKDLLKYLEQMVRPPETLILSHGEEEAQTELKQKIQKQRGIQVIASCKQSEFLFEWN